jgi:hypothetical protein
MTVELLELAAATLADLLAHVVFVTSTRSARAFATVDSRRIRRMA